SGAERALGCAGGDRTGRQRRARAPARHGPRAAGGTRPDPGVTSVLEERLTAQLLAGPPARDPVAVAERLLAVQAQDPRGARLAIRARSQGLTAAIEPLGRLRRQGAAALEAYAADVVRVLG